ncbi:MAG: imidazole glycerol phosphate synthase subunit HisF [Atopococcus tabaci]|uniref:Imidazole glycerol phosphate synthase subunit HisF n=1 Tax=Atopococcus tabaci TaxID=269774 RepID=A0AA43UC67_9LACT|nr:imidazole glycerol phosphate synthase subunit HisF [Atopococcus tabaci]
MKKIVPCLDIKNGRVVKGVQFIDLEDKGDPVELAQKYADQGADEIVFLDIARSDDGHEAMLDLITRVKAVMPDIPLTVGGGISSLSDVEAILQAGADKVSVASAAVKNPDLINAIVNQFSSDVLTIALDVDQDEADGYYYVYTQGGKKKEEMKALDWLKEVESRGAGSLLITSIPADGTRAGFDLDFLKEASQLVSLPIIASGGAGNIDHFVDLFKQTDVAAGLAASIFHNGTVNIQDLKDKLRQEGVDA